MRTDKAIIDLAEKVPCSREDNALKEDKKYEVNCPACGQRFWVCSSIFHLMGIFDLGSADCPGCKLHLNVSYISKEDKMQLSLYEEWMKKWIEEGEKDEYKKDA